MHRPLLATALSIGSLAVPLAATSAGAPSAASPPVADVAAVLAAPADDVGFGQALVDSLTRLRDGGMIADVEVAGGLGDDGAAAALAIEGYAGGEFELVVVAGDAFDQQVQDAAVAHPDQHFAWIAAPDAPDFAEVSALPNVATIVPAAQQGAYVLGQIAGAVSADPAAVALVTPTGEGIDSLFGSGFALGYADIVDGAEVVATPEAPAGAAVFAGGDLAAANAAATAGAVVLYSGFDATPFNDRFAVAMVYRLDPSLYGVLEGLAAGQFPAGVTAATVGNEGVTIVVSPSAALPPEALAAAGDTVAALRSGARDVVIEVPTRVRVDAGDTLESLAESLGVSADQLIEANGLSGTDVTAGTVLVTGLPTLVAAGSPASGASITPNFVPTTAPPTTPAPVDDDADDGSGSGDGSSDTTVPAPGPGTQPPGTQPPATQPPATQPPATQPPTPSVGSCQGMGVGTANQWRAEVGVAALGGGGLGSCDWARHLAETGSFEHAGGVTEVIYRGQSCGGAWSGWRNSSSHYNIIISANYSVGDFSCVVTSDGTAYAVGRLG